MDLYENIVGQKIKELRPMTKAEFKSEYWDVDKNKTVYFLVLENGLELYPSRDTAGNGPGTYFGKFGEETFGLGN